MCNWLISLRINIYFFVLICVSVCGGDLSLSWLIIQNQLAHPIWVDPFDIRSTGLFSPLSTEFLLNPRQLCFTWDGSEPLASSLSLLTFASEGEGVSWSEGREVDRLQRQTSLCLPTCKWPSCLFSWGLDGSQSIAVAGSFFHSICEGNTLKFCVWYMTNETALSSGGAGKARLNDVQPVWSRAGRGTGVPGFCQDPSSHYVQGTNKLKLWYEVKKLFSITIFIRTQSEDTTDQRLDIHTPITCV